MLKMDKVTISDKKYMSIKAYADYKGVTTQSVYNWISDKKVETKKILNTTFIAV